MLWPCVMFCRCSQGPQILSEVGDRGWVSFEDSSMNISKNGGIIFVIWLNLPFKAVVVSLQTSVIQFVSCCFDSARVRVADIQVTIRRLLAIFRHWSRYSLGPVTTMTSPVLSSLFQCHLTFYHFHLPNRCYLITSRLASE